MPSWCHGQWYGVASASSPKRNLVRVNFRKDARADAGVLSLADLFDRAQDAEQCRGDAPGSWKMTLERY